MDNNPSINKLAISENRGRVGAKKRRTGNRKRAVKNLFARRAFDDFLYALSALTHSTRIGDVSNLIKHLLNVGFANAVNLEQIRGAMQSDRCA